MCDPPITTSNVLMSEPRTHGLSSRASRVTALPLVYMIVLISKTDTPEPRSAVDPPASVYRKVH